MQKDSMHILIVMVVRMTMAMRVAVIMPVEAPISVRMAVRMRMIAVVRMVMRVMAVIVVMTVRVSMRMAVRMSVIVASVCMTKCEEADHVDQEAERAHDKQLCNMCQAVSLDYALNSLPHELHTDQHEEDTIAEAGKRIKFAPSIRLVRAGWPLRCDGSAKTNNETQAIEEHVNCIAQKSKRATQVAVDSLHKHERKVQAATAISKAQSFEFVP